MKFEILNSDSSAVLSVQLDKGDSFKAVSGALMGKSASIDVTGTVEGGPINALKRAVLGGEKLFFETFLAQDSGEVMLAPAVPGAIELLTLKADEELFLHGGTLLASCGEIEFDTRLQQTPPGLITGEGLFVQCAKGVGTIAISAFGAVREIAIAAGSDYMVDNNHLLAWRSEQGFVIEKASAGWISSMISGEGFLWRFSGPAQLWLQTRDPKAFSEWSKHFGATR